MNLTREPWFGKRKWFRQLDLTDNYPDTKARSKAEVGKRDEMPANDYRANLVSSQLYNGKHAVTLDLDYPAQLIPTRTPGHYHLYLDPQKQITWSQYKQLLKLLAKLGLIEEGYYKSAAKAKATFLRVPRPQYKPQEFAGYAVTPAEDLW